MVNTSYPTKNALIIGGGLVNTGYNTHKVIEDSDFIIAADGGLDNCIHLNINPDLIIGDLDSATTSSLDLAKDNNWIIRKFSRDKNETDGELAILAAIDYGANNINIIGALKGNDRFDHPIGNMFLISSDSFKDQNITLVEETYEIRVLRKHQILTLSGQPGDIVSLISISDISKGIITWGLKYDLSGVSILRGSTRGMSNELIWRNIEVSISDGILMVYLEHSPV